MATATMAQKDREMRGLELEITRRFLNYGTEGFSDEQERHDLAARVSEYSGGLNCLEWIKDQSTTPIYLPSIYVRFGAEPSPISDADSGGYLHAAFKVDDSVVKDLCIGKYQGYAFTSADSNKYLLSLRGLDPTVSVTLDNFSAYARNGNTNAASNVMHHVTTNAEYAYLALKCKSEGFQPNGNNHLGCDITATDEWGELAHIDTSNTRLGRVLTGSGPVTWSHDGTPYGVWDLNGNVAEHCHGLRLSEGKILIIADNNAASSDSTINEAYQYVLADGSLADEDDGTALGFAQETADYTITMSSYTQDSSNENYYYGYFTKLNQVYTVDGTEFDVPAILKELCIVPHDSGVYNSDRIYINVSGSRGCIRGGNWSLGTVAGVFCLILCHSVSYSSGSRGARPAFVRL